MFIAQTKHIEDFLTCGWFIFNVNESSNDLVINMNLEPLFASSILQIMKQETFWRDYFLEQHINVNLLSI